MVYHILVIISDITKNFPQIFGCVRKNAYLCPQIICCSKIWNILRFVVTLWPNNRDEYNGESFCDECGRFIVSYT